MKRKRVYQGWSRKKRDSVYRRFWLIIFATFLYILLGFVTQMPYMIFQVLLLVEGVAYLQEGFRHSTLRYSNIAIGVLFLFGTFVYFLQSGLTDKESQLLTNQVVVCSLVYVTILGITIWQIIRRRSLYASTGCMVFCVVCGVVAILFIVSMLAIFYQFVWFADNHIPITEKWRFWFDLLKRFLEISGRFPLVEWSMQGTILLSYILMTNKKFRENYNYVRKGNKKHHRHHGDGEYPEHHGEHEHHHEHHGEHEHHEHHHEHHGEHEHHEHHHKHHGEHEHHEHHQE